MKGDDDYDLHAQDYTPGRLLDKASRELGARNDSQFSQILERNAATISRIRSRTAPITPDLMVQIMDRTNWSIKEVRELAGIPFIGAIVLAANQTAPRPPRPQPKPFVLKLTDMQVQEIRLSKVSQSKTAKLYGITQAYVSQIRKNKARVPKNNSA